jgi:hypothetical protein
VIAVSSERNEPTIRPITPKCAPLETALFVPFSGPNSAIGMRITPPITMPSSVARTACQNDRPNTRIGNAPSTTVANVFAPPNATRNRSKGVAVRSAGGIGSMPYCSTSVIGGASCWAGGASSPRGASRAMSVMSLLLL